ncbi:MAG: hypothetical protein JXR94_09510 [Candidatus Hydrogenedentes bacterium]|nr:hypothetical protein [Candidatus Hydrogenedentota bacterium]
MSKEEETLEALREAGRREKAEWDRLRAIGANEKERRLFTQSLVNNPPWYRDGVFASDVYYICLRIFHEAGVVPIMPEDVAHFRAAEREPDLLPAVAEFLLRGAQAFAPDWEDWTDRRLWPLDEAAALVLGLQPVPEHYGHVELFKEPGFRSAIGQVYREAYESCKTGELPTVEGGEPYWVRPADFLEWCDSVGLPIPKPLQKMAKSQNPRKGSRGTGTRPARKRKRPTRKTEKMALLRQSVLGALDRFREDCLRNNNGNLCASRIYEVISWEKNGLWPAGYKVPDHCPDRWIKDIRKILKELSEQGDD